MAPMSTGETDHNVGSRSLPTLHLDLLRTGNAAESKKLLYACQTQGFFYLDLTSDAEVCQQWEDLLLVIKECRAVFGPGLLTCRWRYEPIGTEEGPKPRTRDGYESLKISRRESLQGYVDLTTSISSQSDLFFSFIQKAHAITLMILTQLSLQLGLSGSSSFESYHAHPGPSFSTLGLLHYPKHDEHVPLTSVGHNKHT
ncbi:hypothetical protein V1527DRAFT_516533 [Lipomyces starkeyi]